MCRIAAIISKNISSLESNIADMTEVMYRGGPDDKGHIVNEG
jgi:asparagine synthetase B (glutamine-hydrolysing)